MDITTEVRSAHSNHERVRTLLFAETQRLSRVTWMPEAERSLRIDSSIDDALPFPVSEKNARFHAEFHLLIPDRLRLRCISLRLNEAKNDVHGNNGEEVSWKLPKGKEHQRISSVCL